MQQLNFPPYDIQMKEVDGKIHIFDIVRKKYLLLTPEEWVRQHTVLFLIHHCNYPKSMMRIEGGLQVNKLAKRSDILIFDQQGKPWMLVECKSYAIKLNKDTFFQASLYNASLQVPFILLTNGMTHHCCLLDYGLKKIVPMESIPTYQRDNKV